MGANVAAIIIIKREKELVEHFEQMRATSPGSAQSPEALRVVQDHLFRRLEQRAVIRQSASGLYYLDQPSWNAMHAMRRRTVFIAVGIAAVLAAALAYTAP